MTTMRKRSIRLFAVLALAAALGLATAASPFASGAPDGLERVATEKAFADTGHRATAPIPGYAVPGVADHRVATALAGFAGTLLVFAVGYGVAAVARSAAHQRAPRGPRAAGDVA